MKSITRLLVLLFAITGFLFAQDLTSEATGYGVSKSDAITQAKREALAQGIGQMLTSATEVENFMVKRDVILTQTMGHVKSFTVLKETQGPDGAWEVRIKAVVGKEGLAKDLAAIKILMQTVGNPRIAVLITEENIDKNAPTTGTAETHIVEFFKSKDFRVVDPNQALRFRESPDGVKAIGGDPDAAAKLGTKLNAEVIIVGTAVAKEADVSKIAALANSGTKSANVTLSLKAFNVSNREVLASKTVTDIRMAHINVYTAGSIAIGKAVKNLFSEKGGFFDAMLESWRRGANDGSNFIVMVQGVNDFATAKNVKATITTLCTSVEQRGFNKPNLELEVTRSGSPDDLATALDGLKIGAKQSLSVENVQGNNLVVQLK